MKPLSVLVLCLLAIGASTVSGEAKRRKHYTSSSYLDSYQFPDQPRNGYYDQEESSGESYQDFMDRHYPTSNVGYGSSNGGYGSSNGGYGSSNSGYGGYNNYQIPSLAGGGSRFDLEEGSGAFGHIEQEEGSGGGFFPTDDEDSYPQIPYHVPEVDIFSHTSTSTSTTTTTEKTRPTPPPYIPKESTYEGSGSGDGDDEDYDDDREPDAPTIPAVRIPSPSPTPGSTIIEFEEEVEDIIFEDPNPTWDVTANTPKPTWDVTSRTPKPMVPELPTSPETVPTIETPVTPPMPKEPPTVKLPVTPIVIPSVAPAIPEVTEETTKPTIAPTFRPRPEWPQPSEPTEPSTEPTPTIEVLETNSNYGPNMEKVPTVLVENRILVIILYGALVFLLVLGILVALCMLMRCRKQPPSEVNSDTASSDLPIIKADAKRYTAQIRRVSESPPPLPDLKLFDEPSKSDFNRSRSGGSLRKSKRDLKHPPVNPNWL